MIYLDNSATTKPHPDVLHSFQQVSTSFYANPSSIHPLGGEAEQLLLTAKKQAAKILRVLPEEIIFTASGTEGNNLAIKGVALEHQKRGKHIITTIIEHPSVYNTCLALEKLGFEITYIPVNQDGIVSPEMIEQAIRDDTILISVMHVNNEIGSIQPVQEIGERLRKYPKVIFHVDDVQGFGKVPLNIKESHIDLYTISAHKIHGLKGNGILYKQSRVSLFPLFHGGEQGEGFRAGTENVAGAVSMTKAMRLIKEKEKEKNRYLFQLHQLLRQELEKIEGVFINTPKNAAPHIMNFSLPGLKPEVLIHALANEEIYISTKSACSSKHSDYSRIVAACGKDDENATSALRVSLSYEQTKEEIDTFIHTMKRIITKLRGIMG